MDINVIWALAIISNSKSIIFLVMTSRLLCVAVTRSLTLSVVLVHCCLSDPQTSNHKRRGRVRAAYNYNHTVVLVASSSW